jgi:hypothetical protein
MTFIQVIIIYKTTFILVVVICTRDSITQHSIVLCTYVTITNIHGVVALPSFQLPLAPLAAPSFTPLCTPFVPFSHLLGALQL